jgi:hypothetical protein
MLARALTRKHQEAGIWDVVLALNTVRNDFMHHLESDKRDKRLQVFADALSREFDDPALRDLVRSGEEADQLAMGIALHPWCT